MRVERKIRLAMFAGRFYPDDPAKLREVISSMLASAPRTNDQAPKAVIAPHAGYIYSGPIAASAYARLAEDKNAIRRIILLGPSHRVTFSGLAVPSAEAFATPLGIVPVDREAVSTALSFPQVTELDEAHEFEHSLEVHLPFLQMILNEFMLVPLVAGEASPGEICEVLNVLWGGFETRFVISSDLSHYYDAETARQLDGATAQAFEALNPESVRDEAACGRVPIRGLLEAAKQHNLTCHTVDLRNSGDTAGRRDKVVGYGAFVFSEQPGG